MILHVAFLRASLAVMKRLNHHKTVCSLTRIGAVFCKWLLQIDSNKLFWAEKFCIHFKIFRIMADYVCFQKNMTKFIASTIC